MRPPAVLRGGLVIDGTGGPARREDIAVVGDTIVPVGRIDRGDAVVVDVGGLAVAPGFIDVHTHSDATALQHGGASSPLALAGVRQGVAVEVAGNCGYSLFPGAARAEFAAQLTELGDAIFGEGNTPEADLQAFADRHRKAGRANHLTTLVGHSTLRTAVTGFAQRPLSEAELHDVRELLDRSLSAGAVGWSSGLIYPPGSYSAQDELTALAEVSRTHGVPYVTHMRDEMRYVVEALEEALAIARTSGSALHISHHKTAGRFSAGRSVHTLRMMDEARAEGLDVTCDVYPYTAGSTNLHAMLPPWTAEGGIARLLQRVADPLVREQIRADIESGLPGWENTVGNGGWHLIDVATAPGRTAAEGRSIAELAGATGQDALDYALDLLIEERGHVTIISHSVQEADMRRILAHPGTMIGSDGVPRGGKPHPRWAGTFARVLGRYVREHRVLTLEDAVRRMTAMPAARFGLQRRGSLAAGSFADVVVFDPERVEDRADFTDPLLPPVGIERVLVSGETVFAEGEYTGATPGAVLLRGSAE